MARKVNIDMTGVESYSKASEGIHAAKIAEIEEKTSQGGDPMLQFAFEIIKGEDKGCRVFESFVLTDKALWKLKACLQAIGLKAEGKLKIDLDKLIGKTCDIEVFHDDYNGTTRAKIADFYRLGKMSGKSAAADDEDEDEDEDDEEEAEEKPAKAAKGKKGGNSKLKKPDPDDPDDEDEDDLDDEDDEDEEPAPKRKTKKAAEKAPAKKGGKKKKPEPEPEEEEDEDEDDEEEWEEE